MKRYRIIIRFEINTRNKKPNQYVHLVANKAISGIRFFCGKVRNFSWEQLELEKK